jgi:hypothetical protein
MLSVAKRHVLSGPHTAHLASIAARGPSCILHLASCILHLASCILHLASDVGFIPLSHACAQLLSALQRHATFQIGAQFAVSRRALTRMPAALRGLLQGATRQMLAARPGEQSRLDLCCSSPGAASCLPWILERLCAHTRTRDCTH